MKIADTEGIEAVSMRKIAAKIGSGATSLYRYIDKKEEILDLMIDAVLSEDESQTPSGDWRQDLRKIAYLSRDLILRHPWMINISAFRLSLGANTVRWLEMTLAAIDDLGLDIDEMLAVSNTLFVFARGYAAGEIAEQDASQRSGVSREEWIKSRAHHTRALIETGKYPIFARVVKDAKAPHDPHAAERGFSLGLDHILDGVAARITDCKPDHGRR